MSNVSIQNNIAKNSYIMYTVKMHSSIVLTHKDENVSCLIICSLPDQLLLYISSN